MRPSRQQNSRGAFTLVEIMIVVAVIALLAAIAVPAFMRARKRSQAAQILTELRWLDSAVDQYALEYNKKEGDGFSWNDLKQYIKKDTRLYNAFAEDGSRVDDLFLNPYFTGGLIDTHPDDAGNVTVSLATFHALEDVADRQFWQPFGVQPGE